MSSDGRFVAIRQTHAMEIVDALGTLPRVALDDALDGDFSCVGAELWVAHESLRRFCLETKQLLDTTPLPTGSYQLVTTPGTDAQTGLCVGSAVLLIQRRDSDLQITDISTECTKETFTCPIGGKRLLVANNIRVALRDAGGSEIVSAPLPQRGQVLSGASILAGRALATLVRTDREAYVVVLNPKGRLIHIIKIPPVTHVTWATQRGIALAATVDTNILAIDLRLGRILAEQRAPVAAEGLAVDVNGQFVALAGYKQDDFLSVFHIPYSDLFGSQPTSKRASPESSTPLHRDDDAQEAGKTTADSARELQETPRSEPLDIPPIPLLALAPAQASPPVSETTDITPYEASTHHLSALLNWIVANAIVAITDAMEVRKRSGAKQDATSLIQELRILSGQDIPADSQLWARSYLKQCQQELANREPTHGYCSPVMAIAQEFQLNQTASNILATVAAPSLRGEIARLYAILANDKTRPVCDRYLVEQLLAGKDRQLRDHIAAQLTPDAPLVQEGLVWAGQEAQHRYLFAPLAVDPVLLATLRGDNPSDRPRIHLNNSEEIASGALTDLYEGTFAQLESLIAPNQLKHRLVMELSSPRTQGPLRLAIRGRTGSGRRSLLLALTARANRRLAVIHVDRFPTAGTDAAQLLKRELKHARIRRAIPCISGLESWEHSPRLLDLNQVLSRHLGPITFRMHVSCRVLLPPGCLSVTLPPATEIGREALWQTCLERHDLACENIGKLARRFPIGPGIVETVVQTAAQHQKRGADTTKDAFAVLEKTTRHHIDARLQAIATKVTQLARWEQIAQPDDVVESIREFLSRVQNHTTVFETWGYKQQTNSSGGMHALFHGEPGTGKTLVASLIARELGLDLYRIDLAETISQWIPDKILSDVFDAAEEGRVILLLKNTDLLFPQQSSGESPRNHNISNLLHQLSNFEGIAIFTTIFPNAVDSRWKQQLSLRLAFPFPDEEMRARLWSMHIPPKAPVQGELDFVALAQKYPMAGGYIRNSAIRAAFLAAQEGVALRLDHFHRAIRLEYREMGKLFE